MKPNPGHVPPEAIRKRVNVRLRNGMAGKGWPADPSRWTLIGHPFDITHFELAA